MSLKAITDAISAISVSTENHTPLVFDVDNMVDNVKGLPARVVFAMNTGDNEGRSIQFVTSTTRVATWDIVDLMLYSGVKSGSTIHKATPELVAYVSNYLTAFKNQMGLGIRGVTIENIDATWDQFNFPPSSKNEYYGVLMTLTVKEIIQ